MKKILILILTVCCCTMLGCSGEKITKVKGVTCTLVEEDGEIKARFYNNNNCWVEVRASVKNMKKPEDQSGVAIFGFSMPEKSEKRSFDQTTIEAVWTLDRAKGYKVGDLSVWMEVTKF